MITGVVIAVVTALAWGFQRRLIYLPGGDVPPVATVLPGAREVAVETEDGLTLRAWLLPASGPDRDRTVLFAPGNAGTRADRAPLAQRLAADGYGVLLLDYRGYGGNPGSPTEEGLAADARAAHRYLVDHHGLAPEQVLLLGESLGAAVATRLATERPVGGLVLRSPFTSLADVAVLHYPFLPVRALLRDRYEVRERLRDVRVPVAVVLGEHDEIVPAEQSRAVASAAPSPRGTLEVRGAGHNDPRLGGGEALVSAVRAVSGG
ncbi:alpha/beta fold hydrolase [Pseudonocardia bannensis]|uniref:Alpha/beta fold hydrolase n=1 Tax=Pseudonocardia bannensis TaxID=630973 RepID=A0A848DKE1_9PSEU|nr:alpha/beta fold hydrolase [Pseudonocardia bannensis]